MSTKTPKSTSTNARGRRSKEAILREAVKAFGHHGYRGVSMASIAADAGMTEPGLLHHFRSKQQLLLSLLEDRYHADGRMFSSEDDPQGLGALDVLLELVQKNELDPVGVRLFTVLVAESVAPDHPAHDFFVRRYERVRENLRHLLEEGQRAGDIRSDVDLERLARLLIAVMDGLQIQWLLEPGSDMASAFRLFADLIATSIGLPDEPESQR